MFGRMEDDCVLLGKPANPSNWSQKGWRNVKCQLACNDHQWWLIILNSDHLSSVVQFFLGGKKSMASLGHDSPLRPEAPPVAPMANGGSQVGHLGGPLRAAKEQRRNFMQFHWCDWYEITWYVWYVWYVLCVCIYILYIYRYNIDTCNDMQWWYMIFKSWLAAWTVLQKERESWNVIADKVGKLCRTKCWDVLEFVKSLLSWLCFQATPESGCKLCSALCNLILISATLWS